MVHIKDINRTSSLNRIAPDLFSYKSVLYIGARTARMDYGKEFKESGFDITVAEIYKPNVEYLRSVEWIKEVIECDIRKIDISNTFDVVFWWHGPEHVKQDELAITINRIEKLSRNLVVLGCPWGKFEQGAEDGNPNEVHLSYLLPEDFESIGYSVECLGDKDVRGSNITSVKKIGGSKNGNSF